MTKEELLGQLYDQTLVGNKPAVLELTNAGLAQGLGPETLLYEALIPSLEEVGARFERGDFFVPEMLIAGKAMAGALEILRPLLAETGVQTIGTIVMGTVKGDVHDIGKNLVNIMFEGAGFEVIDLGVQVAPEKFVAAIQEHKPDIVGFSAFLTTTMPMFKANINALEKSGLREQVIVMVGGAPVTQEYADVVGADGYAADASAAVVRAKELLASAEKRSARSLLTGSLFLGPRWDSNATQATAAATVSAFSPSLGAAVMIPTPVKAQSSWSGVFNGVLSYRYDLGLQREGAWETNLAAFGQYFTSVNSNYNLSVVQFDTGPRVGLGEIKETPIAIRPFYYTNYLAYSTSTYATLYGGGVTAQAVPSPKLNLQLTGSGGFGNY